jgi:hypothetical protein
MLTPVAACSPPPCGDYGIHTSRLRLAVKRDSLSGSEPMEVQMAKVAYGLGRFGDLRLGRGRVSGGLAATGPARCSFGGFFTIDR